jgi:mono/diheme cytochrome c family protein
MRATEGIMVARHRGALCAIVIGASFFAGQASLAQGQKQALLARGRVLMEGAVACGNCHGRGPQGQPLGNLSGGFVVVDEPAMRAVAANITPDKATGIGGWTDAQLRRAIREGIRPDGSVIGPPMPIEFYRHLSDRDLDAIVTYLRAQAPVSNKVEKSVYRIPLPPSYGPPLKHVKAPPTSDRRRYGEYLANVAHCMECHTPRTEQGELVTAKLGAGGQAFLGPWGRTVSRNLTPHDSGLKGWSDAEIARAIRTGVSRDGSPLKPPMAFDYYKTISDSDIAALIAYLRSLKPQPFGG